VAISFETLKELMPEIGLKKFDILNEEDKEGTMLAGFSADTGDASNPELTVGVVVSLQEQGEFVQLRVIKLIDQDKVLKSPYRSELASFFLKKNYDRKIGRWCLDPTDGDLYIDWAVAIEDNEQLTLKQIKRMFTSLVLTVKDCWIPIRNILEVGTEIKLSADDLKKEILFTLMNAKQFDLMQMLASVSDTSTLSKIQTLVSNGKFDEVKDQLVRS
jgi:hypothetical protein